MHILEGKAHSLASHLKVLILDVDGVLTDGTLAYTAEGEKVKRFNAKDGFGIRMLQESGVVVAVITARESPPLARRMADLRIEHYYTGCDNKFEAFEALLNTLSVAPEQVGYVGDDILDIPVMKHVGFPICVGDGHFYAKEQALWVTSQHGGKGAVREVCDAIISARCDLRSAYEQFLDEHVGKTEMNKL